MSGGGGKLLLQLGREPRQSVSAASAPSDLPCGTEPAVGKTPRLPSVAVHIRVGPGQGRGPQPLYVLPCSGSRGGGLPAPVLQ